MSFYEGSAIGPFLVAPVKPRVEIWPKNSAVSALGKTPRPSAVPHKDRKMTSKVSNKKRQLSKYEESPSKCKKREKIPEITMCIKGKENQEFLVSLNIEAEGINLPDKLSKEITDLQSAAFPDTEEFKTQRWWHTPPTMKNDVYGGSCEWWVTSRLKGASELVGSVRVVPRLVSKERNVLNGDILVAGIANVCSRPCSRGSGAARVCLEAVNHWILERQMEDENIEAFQIPEFRFGLLFTGTSCEGFYNRTGWSKIENRFVGLEVRKLENIESAVVADANSNTMKKGDFAGRAIVKCKKKVHVPSDISEYREQISQLEISLLEKGVSMFHKTASDLNWMDKFSSGDEINLLGPDW